MSLSLEVRNLYGSNGTRGELIIEFDNTTTTITNWVDIDKEVVEPIVACLKDVLRMKGKFTKEDLVSTLIELDLLEKSDVLCYAANNWEMGDNDY